MSGTVINGYPSNNIGTPQGYGDSSVAPVQSGSLSGGGSGVLPQGSEGGADNGILPSPDPNLAGGANLSSLAGDSGNLLANIQNVQILILQSVNEARKNNSTEQADEETRSAQADMDAAQKERDGAKSQEKAATDAAIGQIVSGGVDMVTGAASFAVGVGAGKATDAAGRPPTDAEIDAQLSPDECTEVTYRKNEISHTVDDMVARGLGNNNERDVLDQQVIDEHQAAIHELRGQAADRWQTNMRREAANLQNVQYMLQNKNLGNLAQGGAGLAQAQNDAAGKVDQADADQLRAGSTAIKAAADQSQEAGQALKALIDSIVEAVRQNNQNTTDVDKEIASNVKM